MESPRSANPAWSNPPRANPITLVCFDLGGVVLRICRTWAEGCGAAGLDVRGDIDAMLARSDAWPELNGAYQRGRIDVDAFIGRFRVLIGGLYSPEEILRVHLAWTLEEYEGVGDVVDRLHEEGMETAVLSNTCHEHWGLILEYPAVGRLRNRHASHLIEACKPDHEAYRTIENATGRRGAEILFFDDLEENVDAAREVGWHAVQIDPHGRPARQMISVLDELLVLNRRPTS